jgi:NTP pyrophosphatase (non-canonical NTP hydrolase)
MEFAEICKTQILDDQKRGFPVTFGSERETHAQLIKDLVGLFGEVGEFSDLAKKVGLKLDHPGYDGPTLSQSRERLGKELGDILIYTIRLAAILGVDLESVILKTIRNNKDRYAYLHR